MPAIRTDLGGMAGKGEQDKCDHGEHGGHTDSAGLLWGGCIFYWVTREAGKAALLSFSACGVSGFSTLGALLFLVCVF